MRANCGHHDDDAEIAALTEVLAAMFEGLLVRSIRNPGMDPQIVIRKFQRVIRFLVTDALGCGSGPAARGADAPPAG